MNIVFTRLPNYSEFEVYYTSFEREKHHFCSEELFVNKIFYVIHAIVTMTHTIRDRQYEHFLM